MVCIFEWNKVQGFMPPKVKYHHGPDVPKHETLLCRYPADFETIRKQIDLKQQQKGDLRCDLKYYNEIQRSCDFRKVNRYQLVTITLPNEHIEYVSMKY